MLRSSLWLLCSASCWPVRPRTRNHLVVVVGIFVACRCCGLSAKCFHIASCCLQCLCAPFGGVIVVHCRVVSCAVGCVCTYFLTCLGPVNRSAFSTKPTLRKTPLQRRVFFCCHMELYRPMREVNYNIALDFVDNTSLNYVHCLCPRN